MYVLRLKYSVAELESTGNNTPDGFVYHLEAEEEKAEKRESGRAGGCTRPPIYV